MMMSYTLYAYWYFRWNHPGDKYQLHFLVAAVVLGLLPQPFLGTGLLIGTFCVIPRVFLSSLLVSDLFHLGLKRRSRNRPHARALGDEAVAGEKV